LSVAAQEGATVRMYIEKYTPPGDEAALAMETADALAPLIALGLELSQVQQLTGRDAPTVIT
jgi:phosphoglucomutase